MMVIIVGIISWLGGLLIGLGGTHTVSANRIETAVTACTNNGKIKSLEVSLSNREVVCNNGARFKLQGE